MRATGCINYLELPSRHIEASKKFFTTVFNWVFVDYGPDYAAFSHTQTGIDGGFFKSDKTIDTDTGSVLMVLYSHALEETLLAIQNHGGEIKKPIFSFPGGRRFHFIDPSGNEFAVWSDIDSK